MSVMHHQHHVQRLAQHMGLRNVAVQALGQTSVSVDEIDSRVSSFANTMATAAEAVASV